MTTASVTPRATPAFGQRFTDHLVRARWTERDGWAAPRLEPYGPIAIDPAAAVLHYAQEVFEGLKAYRHPDGSLRTFRWERNAARLQRSAHRLALPELPREAFLHSLRMLVAADADQVPSDPESSLYLRPFLFAREPFLGVRPAREVEYCVIASPSGPLFSADAALELWLSDHWTRAGRGGLGRAKTGANYAASLLPHAEALAEGCDQVLFLDGRNGTHLEECGSMNLVLVADDRRLIAPESESILEGVTLESILALGRERGFRIEQRPVTLAEWADGVASGSIVEAFACGTAAVVAPIGVVRNHTVRIDMPRTPSVAPALRDDLMDIQYGRGEDRHGWMTRLDDDPGDTPPPDRTE